MWGKAALIGSITGFLPTDALANQKLLSKIPIKNRKSCQIVIPTSQSNDPLKIFAKKEKSRFR